MKNSCMPKPTRCVIARIACADRFTTARSIVASEPNQFGTIIGPYDPLALPQGRLPPALSLFQTDYLPRFPSRDKIAFVLAKAIQGSVKRHFQG